MKVAPFSWHVLLLLVGVIGLSATATSASGFDEYAVAVHFNKGTEDETMHCSDVDHRYVQDVIFQAAKFGQRVLRGHGSRMSSSKQGSGATTTRELARLVGCTGCGTLCKFAKPKCANLQGAGRRQRQLGENSTGAVDIVQLQDENVNNSSDEPSLQAEPLDFTGELHCSQSTVEHIDRQLNGISEQLSDDSCRRYVAAPRRYTCEAVAECDIEYFTAWTEGASDGSPLRDWTSFCQFDRITFQAITNFYLGKVQFTLNGPRGFYYEIFGYDEPYFLTESATDHSLELSPGAYTLSAWPENKKGKMKTTMFRVNRCY